MVGRARHPKKQVEDALVYAEGKGWTVNKRDGRGHAWGVAHCGGDCTVWIWSTPANPDNHARQIRRAIDSCSHQEAEQ